MNKPKNILWLRSELRLQDNPLLDLCQDNPFSRFHKNPKEFKEIDKIIYIFDQKKPFPGFDFPPLGPKYEEVIHEGIESLKPLQISLYDEEKQVVLRDFLKEGYAIYYIPYPTFDESSLENQLSYEFPGQMIPLNAKKQTLWPRTFESLPETFTQFRKKMEIISLDLPPCWGEGDYFYENIPKNNYPGPRHLEEYLWESSAAHSYKETRNSLQGKDSSTRFSMYLAHGMLTPLRIMSELKEFEKTKGANDSTYWIFFELMWRDYFYHLAQQKKAQFFPQWGEGIQDGRMISELHKQNFQKWRLSQTSSDLINAGMKELSKTGWLSNRMRQIVASYLIYELEVPWSWGARWFQYSLKDFDPCLNTGNWTYIAGLGQDPRGGRKFNVQRQKDQYDPEGVYVKYWLDDQ